MGMAASQARYLQLTARKTNVEFAGQQINQQRTALSNESAGLFTQLMGLKVPTAPSSGDFTTTQYTFNDGINACTITDMQALSGDPYYNYTVKYYYMQNVPTGVGKTRTDLGVNNLATPPADPIYWLTDGSTKINKALLTHCTADTTSPDYKAEDAAALLQICKDNASSTLRTTCAYDPATQTLGNVTGAYRYTNTNGVTYYYSSSDLSAAAASGGSAVSLTGYYSSSIDKKIFTDPPIKAKIDTTDSGRYSSIQLEDYSTSFDLTATSTTNTAAYNDAMNEYEYQQTAYEQQVTAINAKTSIIQNEDKTLELKLKQLDTEQEALSTEMDSVKKVIDKNIEQTFKTFS